MFVIDRHFKNQKPLFSQCFISILCFLQNFKMWKEHKDEKLVDEHRRKVEEKHRKIQKEKEEKRKKERQNETAFTGWYTTCSSLLKLTL